jgi:hypothetical protein
MKKSYLCVLDHPQRYIPMNNSELSKRIDHILLECLDGKRFKVKLNIAKMFNMIRGMLENCEIGNEPIKLSVVSSTSFEKMVRSIFN